MLEPQLCPAGGRQAARQPLALALPPSQLPAASSSVGWNVQVALQSQVKKCFSSVSAINTNASNITEVAQLACEYLGSETSGDDQATAEGSGYNKAAVCFAARKSPHDAR